MHMRKVIDFIIFFMATLMIFVGCNIKDDLNPPGNVSESTSNVLIISPNNQSGHVSIITDVAYTEKNDGSILIGSNDEIEVELEAFPSIGYSFESWDLNGNIDNTSGRRIKVRLTGKIYLRSVFSKKIINSEVDKVAFTPSNNAVSISTILDEEMFPGEAIGDPVEPKVMTWADVDDYENLGEDETIPCDDCSIQDRKTVEEYLLSINDFSKQLAKKGIDIDDEKLTLGDGVEIFKSRDNFTISRGNTFKPSVKTKDLSINNGIYHGSFEEKRVNGRMGTHFISDLKIVNKLSSYEYNENKAVKVKSMDNWVDVLSANLSGEVGQSSIDLTLTLSSNGVTQKVKHIYYSNDSDIAKVIDIPLSDFLVVHQQTLSGGYHNVNTEQRIKGEMGAKISIVNVGTGDRLFQISLELYVNNLYLENNGGLTSNLHYLEDFYMSNQVSLSDKKVSVRPKLHYKNSLSGFVRVHSSRQRRKCTRKFKHAWRKKCRWITDRTYNTYFESKDGTGVIDLHDDEMPDLFTPVYSFQSSISDYPNLQVLVKDGNDQSPLNGAIDFGSMRVGIFTSTKEIIIKNESLTKQLTNVRLYVSNNLFTRGKADFKVTEVNGSSTNLEAIDEFISIDDLAPGETATVKVEFCPWYRDYRKAELKITCSSPKAPINVVLEGEGIAPRITLKDFNGNIVRNGEILPVYFGKSKTGDPIEKVFVVENTGEYKLSISSPDPSLGREKVEDLTSTDSNPNNSDFKVMIPGVPIEKDHTTEMKIIFDPDPVSFGSKTYKVEISHNDLINNQDGRFTFYVSGTALRPKLRVIDPYGIPITDIDKSYTYPNTEINGVGINQNFSLINAGIGTLTLSSITKSYENTNGQSGTTYFNPDIPSSALPVTLEKGEKFNLPLNFNPGTPGQSTSAKFVVSHSDDQSYPNSEFPIKVNGIGIEKTLSVKTLDGNDVKHLDKYSVGFVQISETGEIEFIIRNETGVQINKVILEIESDQDYSSDFSLEPSSIYNLASNGTAQFKIKYHPRPGDSKIRVARLKYKSANGDDAGMYFDFVLKIDREITFVDSTFKNTVKTKLGITDSIMASDISEIRDLDISFSGISNLEDVKNFENLEKLKAAGNTFFDIRPVTVLKHLKSLDISENNNVTDISFLTGLKDTLKELSISNTRVTDVFVISRLYSISVLKAAGIDLRNDLSIFDDVGINLKELDLGRCNISDISKLSRFINIEKLILNKNTISDISALTSLQNLTYLDISYNQVNRSSQEYIDLKTRILNNNGYVNDIGNN